MEKLEKKSILTTGINEEIKSCIFDLIFKKSRLLMLNYRI